MTDEETDEARLAQMKQTLEDDGVFCYDDGVWLLAQLAARTRRLEDTDAALVACERSRDQAKAALAERTRDCETLKEEILRQDARLRAVEQAAQAAVAFLDWVEWTDDTSERNAADVMHQIEEAVDAASAPHGGSQG